MASHAYREARYRRDVQVRSSEEVVAGLRALQEQWWTYDGTERAASQTFLNQLVGCFTGEADVFAVGASFEQFGSRAKGSGYMDLHWPEKCIIEMKAPSVGRSEAQWAKAVEQARDYWLHSADVERGIPAPRFLVICSFVRFEVWEPGRFPNAPIDRFSIEELPDRYGSLLFLAGGEPIVGGPGEQVSAEAAEALAEVYFSLLDRNAADSDTLRRFVLQVTWCLFAEDLGMLPAQPVERLLRALVKDPSRSSHLELGGLFYALSVPDQRERDNTGIEGLPYVNGGLFELAARVRLEPAELEGLVRASTFDWRAVDPTIFGGLMESCLGRERRWELGAHYTYEQDIMSIVGPTIVVPWRDRIEAASSPTEADEVLSSLTEFEVLDPACGCGNFLAIAYRELRHLTAQAVDRRDRLYRATGANPPEQRPFFPLSNIHGIEIDPFAVQITRVTLWMTHKLVADQYGMAEAVLPLVDLSNIVCADALAVDWPKAEAIISNPPYHGTKSIRSVLGDEYVSWLDERFGVGVKDLCVYWFLRAQENMRPGDRAGLVATNSIREGLNRSVTLDRLVAAGAVITDAISSKKWPGDANVSVSLVNWVASPEDPPQTFTLDGRVVDGITTGLRPGPQLPDPLPLKANEGKQFYGIVPGGPFVIESEQASELLKLDDADYSDVVRRYVIGDDLVKSVDHAPQRWVINFGEMPLETAATYPAALEYVRQTVKPGRDTHKQRRERQEWWKPSRSVQETLRAIQPLSRWIACPATGKRFAMVWCEPEWCPSNAVSVFAFEDDWTFGVLSSRLHQVWATEVSTKLEQRPRYTSASFMTFPFPQRSAPSAEAIESAAREIVSLRRRHCDTSRIGLTRLYNLMDEGGYADLAVEHRQLDDAVCAAYGFAPSVLDSVDDIMQALTALNLSRAAQEGDPQIPA